MGRGGLVLEQADRAQCEDVSKESEQARRLALARCERKQLLGQAVESLHLLTLALRDLSRISHSRHEIGNGQRTGQKGRERKDVQRVRNL